MATFGEIVYMVLDMLKEHSDDAYYTEEHIIFLASKMRALLLERKYKNSRNGSYSVMSEENQQQVCLMLSPFNSSSIGNCESWLRSDSAVPKLLFPSEAVTCTGHDLLFTDVTFVPKERLPYVGFNHWLKRIIYAALSIDGHLYLKGIDPSFKLLERAGLTGVFSDPVEAAKLSHEACMNGGMCDILEATFPLEAALVPSCIELVVQELTGSRYAPEDKKNNAKDDLGEAAVTNANTTKPAENSTYKPREEAE